MHQPEPLMAAGFPAAAAAPGIMGLPANNSPANGEYLKSKLKKIWIKFLEIIIILLDQIMPIWIVFSDFL